MILYVVTVIKEDDIEVQTVYNDVDKAVQGMICEMHRIAEKTDISYRYVKELEQEMWQSSLTPNHSVIFVFFPPHAR